MSLMTDSAIKPVGEVIELTPPSYSAEIDEFLPEVIDRVAQDNYHFKRCQTALNFPSGPVLKMDVVAAILKTTGNYSSMARLLRRNRNTIVSYVHSNADVATFFSDTKESKLDEIEDQLYEMALAGDRGLMRFLMQTVGKSRGFTTRTEHTGKDGEAIQVEPPRDKVFKMLDRLRLEDIEDADQV